MGVVWHLTEGQHLYPIPWSKGTKNCEINKIIDEVIEL